MRVKLAILLISAVLLVGCGDSSPPAPEDSVMATLESIAAQSTQQSVAGVTTEQPIAVEGTPEQPIVEQSAAEEQAADHPAALSVTEPVAESPVSELPPSDETNLPDPQAAAIAYNLPPATLNTETGLYVSPNRDDLFAPIIIPAGQTIYLMGRNATSSHLRAVWNTGVGWVPVSFTSYSGNREGLETLPVFEQEPPRCAVPVVTQFNLGSMWTADQRMRVVVVVDLFRSRYGDFPQSYLLLTVNGAAVEDSRRPIVERGQFSLKDIVFSLPSYIQAGDTLGYRLETTSAEDLAFMATVFHVPDGCVWNVD